MANDPGLTEPEALWLRHDRACGKGSLKADAAKSRLEREGALP